MTHGDGGRIAILYPGDYEGRRNATAENNRFAELFRAFIAKGIHAEPAVYRDDFCEEVREQLMQLDGVLVWVNPIQDGRTRSILDSMLREVAAAGIFVSAHPDIILKLGTKEALYRTRNLGWGCDTHLYESMEEMRYQLPLRLADGKARVLKQYRGNGGLGIWKVQLPMNAITGIERRVNALPRPETLVRVRHAKRGCGEEEITLGEFFARCEQYFVANGRMVDQEYQERLSEGMIRCYLVHDRVAGFGHQAINALFPAPPDAPPTESPQPEHRLYHPPTKPEFQALKHKLEHEWLPVVQQLLEIDTDNLPILWDCDFLLGPKEKNGEDTYVL
ncbi:MAG TPA: Cj0069 family protein, partial [Candidatus Binatia bacterium]|nr:Cj0069 family protein [Candidatus Binatia bacterium]